MFLQRKKKNRAVPIAAAAGATGAVGAIAGYALRRRRRGHAAEPPAAGVGQAAAPFPVDPALEADGQGETALDPGAEEVTR